MSSMRAEHRNQQVGTLARVPSGYVIAECVLGFVSSEWTMDQAGMAIPLCRLQGSLVGSRGMSCDWVFN